MDIFFLMAVVAREGKERMNRQNGAFLGSETVLYITMVDTCHHTFVKPTECTAPRVNPNASYRLWMIMMCQRKLINPNKCTPVTEGVDNGGSCVCVRVGMVYEKISVTPSQFSCEPKTALKNKSDMCTYI